MYFVTALLTNILLYFVDCALGECHKMLSLFLSICEVYMLVRKAMNNITLPIQTICI